MPPSAIDLAVVQAVFAMSPELDRVWTHSKTRPEWGARDFAAFELLRQPFESRHQFRTRTQSRALIWCARREPALSGPGRPVCISLCRRNFLDASLSAHLAARCMPIDCQ